jgi:hypothetical protein
MSYNYSHGRDVPLSNDLTCFEWSCGGNEFAKKNTLLDDNSVTAFSDYIDGVQRGTGALQCKC